MISALTLSERHQVEEDAFMLPLWGGLTAQQFRTRPQPGLNSIAWNIWHAMRVEDAGINRMVWNGTQVLDAGDWGRTMNWPSRQNGYAMHSDEVDAFNAAIELDALRGYCVAVRAQTRAMLPQIATLDERAVIDGARLHRVLFDEGLAHRDGHDLYEGYKTRTIGRCVLSFAFLHVALHMGEIDVLASLHGVRW
jgi:hypothetical protein